MSKYIALDVGMKRVGVAMSDDLAIIATPYKTLDREGSATEIARLALEERAVRIIVGLPYLPSGGLGSQAADVNDFVEELHRQTNLPIDFENEVLTSVEAENRLKNISQKQRQKGDVDAMAACIILESYMRRTDGR